MLHARRIAVVTPRRGSSMVRRGTTAGRGQRRSKMNPRGRYYIRLIPIHSSGQENDVRRRKRLPVCAVRGREKDDGDERRAAARGGPALRGYRSKCPMNERWALGPTIPRFCPLPLSASSPYAPPSPPCEFESDFKPVSRALRGIAIRLRSRTGSILHSRENDDPPSHSQRREA